MSSVPRPRPKKRSRLPREQRPFLAVMDIRLASERDGIDAAKELFGELAIRCIFATAHETAHPRTRRAVRAARLAGQAHTMPSLIALIRDAAAKPD